MGCSVGESLCLWWENKMGDGAKFNVPLFDGRMNFAVWKSGFVGATRD